MTTMSHNVTLSTIILTTDNKELDKKRCEANHHPKQLCEKSICLIENTKKIKLQHLNESKLHLN